MEAHEIAEQIQVLETQNVPPEPRLVSSDHRDLCRRHRMLWTAVLKAPRRQRKRPEYPSVGHLRSTKPKTYDRLLPNLYGAARVVGAPALSDSDKAKAAELMERYRKPRRAMRANWTPKRERRS